MRDFSLKIYKRMLVQFLASGYNICTFENYITSTKNEEKVLILRHDLDKKPFNSLLIAKIENELGISSTYYFRIVKESYDEAIIEKIKLLGHEIGFHYEDLTLAKGIKEKAIELFESNLDKLRKYYPIKTICMHGSPLSKWNNLDIWKDYDYKSFGIIGDPNFDIDFTKIFYLTETGMAWNQEKYAIRDVAKGNFNIKISSTIDIILRIKDGTLPNKLMINTHPQRWSNSNIEWTSELILQSLKNQIKRLFKKRNNNVN
jgi:hypothetical protein